MNTTTVQRSLRVPMSLKMPEISLDAAGLVALADLTTVQKRTALTGTAALLDTFILCPGFHMQQDSSLLGINGGERPICASLTTDYAFRIENSAMVCYLQQVGKTGHLTTLHVSRMSTPTYWLTRLASMLFPFGMSVISGFAYTIALLWTIAVTILLSLSYDW